MSTGNGLLLLATAKQRIAAVGARVRLIRNEVAQLDIEILALEEQLGLTPSPQLAAAEGA